MFKKFKTNEAKNENFSHMADTHKHRAGGYNLIFTG